jgi:hypothetical protein
LQLPNGHNVVHLSQMQAQPSGIHSQSACQSDVIRWDSVSKLSTFAATIYSTCPDLWNDDRSSLWVIKTLMFHHVYYMCDKFSHMLLHIVWSNTSNYRDVLKDVLTVMKPLIWNYLQVMCLLISSQQVRLTLKGSLSLRKAMFGTSCSQNGKPLLKQNVFIQ